MVIPFWLVYMLYAEQIQPRFRQILDYPCYVEPKQDEYHYRQRFLADASYCSMSTVASLLVYGRNKRPGFLSDCE